jgi:hypothetical protein
MSTISAGTTTPTALSLSGDTTGALTFQVNGTTTAATITSAGNVGIGTASPVQLLTVESTSNVRATIRNSTENTSYASSLDFATGSGSLASTNVVGRVQCIITQADPSALQGALLFTTNSGDSATEKMRINAAGNVGIGSTTPGTYSERLVVASPGSAQASMMLLNPGQGSGQLGIAASGSNFKIYNTFTDGLLANGKGIDITSTGNVGIGTTAPGNSRLRVDNASGTFGASNPLQSWAYANFQVTNLHLDGSVNPVFNTDADSNWNPPATMIWQFRGAERMRITSGGNLGVGQGTPTARLDVLADSGNIVRFINSSVVDVSLAAGSTSFTTLSDERSKTDLAPISDAVSKLKELRTVVGRYNQDAVGVERSFLIAQDVQKVFAPAVDANKPDELGLRYTDMIPLLVAAIKEQQEQIKALQDKVTALETK